MTVIPVKRRKDQAATIVLPASAGFLWLLWLSMPASVLGVLCGAA